MLAVFYDVHWPVDLAIGTTILSGLVGLILSVIVLPPAVPDGGWEAADSAKPAA